MSKHEIGKRIRFIRESFEYSQEQVANYLNVERTYISMIENGERIATPTIVEMLSDLFGIPTSEFLKPAKENSQELAMEVAFRGNPKQDAHTLRQIASFKRVVSNYLKMDKIQNK
jgi:transcriptional regulator with XRE-family HTH domain